MITLEMAKNLTHGEVLYHVSNRNADGTPQRWRVNGQVKIWKRDPSRVRVPIKYGLRGYDYLTEYSLDLFCTTELEAIVTPCIPSGWELLKARDVSDNPKDNYLKFVLCKKTGTYTEYVVWLINLIDKAAYSGYYYSDDRCAAEKRYEDR